MGLDKDYSIWGLHWGPLFWETTIWHHLELPMGFLPLGAQHSLWKLIEHRLANAQSMGGSVFKGILWENAGVSYMKLT